MEKHLTDEQLAIYSQFLKGGNTKYPSSEIAEHITNCDSCASQAIELSFIIEDLEKELSPNKKIKSHTLRNWLIAASILLPIIIWVSIQISSKNQKEKFAEKQEIEDTIDTTNEVQNKITPNLPNIGNTNKKKYKMGTSPKNNNNILASYTPNPEFEQLYNNFKSEMRGEEIEIITKNDIKLSKNKTILLEWENPKNTNLTIEIFDNKGTNIISENINGETFQINKELNNGLYYWKLFNDEFDLLWCGKIIIK